MWCSRCQKKFCQDCLKPVTFIPVQMHIAFGQCKGKEFSKEEILSMLLIICTFILFLIFLILTKDWHIPIIFLISYYFLFMLSDWIAL